MKKSVVISCLLLLLAIPVRQSSAQTHVLDFNNTSRAGWTTVDYDPFGALFNDEPTYEGFNFAGFGFLRTGSRGKLVGYGDGFSLLMHSSSEFIFTSALIASIGSTHNLICARGYRPGDFLGSFGQACGPNETATYSRTFYADADIQQRVLFDWAGVTTIAFSSSGGTDRRDNSTQFLYSLDDISVTTTAAPEPASLILVATGVIAAAGAVTRKRTR